MRVLNRRQLLPITKRKAVGRIPGEEAYPWVVAPNILESTYAVMRQIGDLRSKPRFEFALTPAGTRVMFGDEHAAQSEADRRNAQS